MKYLPLFMLLLIIVPANAQQIVKVNALELYDKIPLPPADCKEAYLKAECKEEGDNVTCDEFKAFKPLEDKVTKINQDFEKVLRALAEAEKPGMKEEDAKEIKKKMKSMTKEEKMRYAMQMSQSMSMTTRMEPESPAVHAAVAEYNAMAQASAKKLQDSKAIEANYKRKQELGEKRKAEHEKIDAWTEAEARKLPQVSTGEMGGPEPKAYHALRVKAMHKHIAVENEYLTTLRKIWTAERDDIKTLFTPFQQKLAAVHYGEDARNTVNKRSLVTGHAMTFNGFRDLISESRNATAESAQWWGQKIMLDKEKP